MKAFSIVFSQNFPNDQASQVAVASPRTPIRNFCVYLAPFVHQICRFLCQGKPCTSGVRCLFYIQTTQTSCLLQRISKTWRKSFCSLSETKDNAFRECMATAHCICYLERASEEVAPVTSCNYYQRQVELMSLINLLVP